MKNVYVSASMTNERSLIIEVIEKIKETCLAKVSCWNRATPYDPKITENIDAIVVIHPSNKFEYNIDSLTQGVLIELKKAQSKAGVRIYGAYKKTNGDLQIYEAEMIDDNVLLKGGSYNSLKNYCSSNFSKNECKENVIINDEVDDYLLLCVI